ncbi:DUF58 domain-containing protein [Pleionea sp. CnH1-48]|uniref:DUF58 domain-containing protein n=1 Tax=Pleionea sp. CnH1-48 TaxID=2954494 RepID=UPI002096A09F|nr:DUF58 domain-containing protein [Pleionea sp. CnH1-48]MCO7222975.1 DUF58 domain-containing protein [Pleionea sp. CnH1-48]
MKNRRSHQDHKQHAQHKVGIELSLEELLECKQVADLMQLPTHQKVKAHLLGGYISHFKGRGMDFDEARPYQQGDDIRSIDWRVTARTGEAHTKIYREEKERPVFVLLDQSPGMMFGTRTQFKSVLAANIASIIMWRSLADGNRFGAMLFDNDNHFEYKPASSRKNCLKVLNKIVENHNQQIDTLYSKRAPNDNEVAAKSLVNTLARARYVARPGSLIFLISDFFNFNEEAEHHLVRLAQHNDVHLAQISDPIEKELPPPGRYTITDGKQRAIFDTYRNKTRKGFHDSYEAFSNNLQHLCNRHRMHLTQLTTSEHSKQIVNITSSKRGQR